MKTKEIGALLFPSLNTYMNEYLLSSFAGHDIGIMLAHNFAKTNYA